MGTECMFDWSALLACPIFCHHDQFVPKKENGGATLTSSTPLRQIASLSPPPSLKAFPPPTPIAASNAFSQTSNPLLNLLTGGTGGRNPVLTSTSKSADAVEAVLGATPAERWESVGGWDGCTEEKWVGGRERKWFGGRKGNEEREEEAWALRLRLGLGFGEDMVDYAGGGSGRMS
jgi:hypothetical protein